MDDRTFDAVARVASRRWVLGGLAATFAAVAVRRTVTAAPSPKAACMKTATSAARDCRKATAGLKGQEKATALKACQAQFRTDRAACVGSGTDEGDDDEGGETTPV